MFQSNSVGSVRTPLGIVLCTVNNWDDAVVENEVA